MWKNKRKEQVMIRFFWGVSLLFGLIAGVYFIVGIERAAGAPDEASTAGIALCIAVIPYIVARGVAEVIRNSKEKGEK
jgi:lipid-A-disaccharide synthase-like uncharacterized protein